MAEASDSARRYTDLPTMEMEKNYSEYRRACYAIIDKHAGQRGLLGFLKEPRSFPEIKRELNVVSERDRALELLLKALVKFGSVKVVGDEQSPQKASYQVDAQFTQGEIDEQRVKSAIGVESFEKLIHSNSYSGIIDTLSESQNRVAADFVAKNLPLWDEFLQQPFYAFGRQHAVESVAKPGGRVLDLACGPGYGLLELLDRTGPSGQVVGLEYSHDFVVEAVQRIKGKPAVTCAQCDLDDGFPFIRDGWFDGAIIIGAFHFLKKKNELFANVARALKVGGQFCVGYAYLSAGTYDQEIMDLRLKLREPPANPVSREELLGWAEGAGLALRSDHATIGCFGWFLFERIA